VVLVCAPPLLLTVTPVPTEVLDDVAPEVDVAPVVTGPVTVDPELVVVDPELVEVDPEVVEVVSPPVVAAVEVPVLAAPAAESAPADEAPVDDEPDVSAVATPGDVMTITPMPKAAANAPTRPM
jgi:ribonuclease E